MAELTNKKVKAMPYDENGRTLAGMVVPTVDGAGNITGWTPLAVVDQGNGTFALQVSQGSNGGVAEHHNGNATVTPADVTFSGTSKSILIQNRDGTNNLLVSFDGGSNTKTVDPNQSLSIDASHTVVKVSSSAGTVAYEMLVTV